MEQHIIFACTVVVSVLIMIYSRENLRLFVLKVNNSI